MIKDHFEPLSVHFYVTARRLNEYIRHYEPLSYPTEEVHRGHLRAKRSVTRDNSVTLKFRSHGRDFHIRLKRDLATFSNNLIIEGPSGQTEDLDTSHIYQGHLVGKFDHHFPSVHSAIRIISVRILRLYVKSRFNRKISTFFSFLSRNCCSTTEFNKNNTRVSNVCNKWKRRLDRKDRWTFHENNKDPTNV